MKKKDQNTSFRMDGEPGLPAPRQAGTQDRPGKPKKAAKRRRYSRGVRGVVIACASLLSLLALGIVTASIYAWVMLDRVNYEGEESFIPLESLPPEEIDPDFSGEEMENPDDHAVDVSGVVVKGNTNDVTNFLLLGIDERANSHRFVGRSDTTMILSVNKKTRTIKLISLLRDTWVTIPGRDKNGDGKDDYAKLNAAYAYGGFSLLSKTIEQNFRLKIDEYVAVNFGAFPIAVDALGGVDLALTAGEAKIVGVGGGKAGTYHLNGERTLTYARIRHLDSDFGRTARQRKVVTALINKAKGMNVVTLNNILYKVLPEVKTNMTSDEFLGFTINVLTYAGYAVQSNYSVPQPKDYTGKYINGGAGLWLNDSRKSVVALHEYIYG